MGVFRTRANRTLAVFRLQPYTGEARAPSKRGLLQQPGLGGETVPEIVFSDGRRLVGDSPEAAAERVAEGRSTCTAASGAVNAEKLKAYAVLGTGGCMVYRVGHVDTVAGRLTLQGSGLAVVGVPMVMGEDTSTTIAALEEKLAKLCPALWRTRPSYVLAVRVYPTWSPWEKSPCRNRSRKWTLFSGTRSDCRRATRSES